MSESIKVDTWGAIEVMKALAPAPIQSLSFNPISSLDAKEILKAGMVGSISGFSVVKA